MAEEDGNKQLLHLVFGGELKSLSSTEFRDLDALDIVGIYPDYASAKAAWKGKAQVSMQGGKIPADTFDKAEIDRRRYVRSIEARFKRRFILAGFGVEKGLLQA